MFWKKSVTQTTKTDGPHKTSLTQSRFSTVLFIFKLAGIPLSTQSTSSVHSAYNATIVVCFYITCVSCFMDILNNKDNLEQLIKSIREFLPMVLVIVNHVFFRYDNSNLNEFLIVLEHN